MSDTKFVINNLMEQVMFGDPFYNHIIPNISAADIHNLVQTCKKYKNSVTRRHIETSIINSINNRLRKIFEDKFEDFKNVLKKTGSVISGSFIIQCILDEYYDDSDVDIFVPIKENITINRTNFLGCKSEVNDFLYSIMKREGEYEGIMMRYRRDVAEEKILNVRGYVRYVDEPISSYCDNWLNPKNAHKIDKNPQDTFNRYKKMENYLTFQHEKNSDHRKKYKVDVILLNCKKSYKTLCNFVNEDFDFDICKNIYYYDGNDNIVVNNLRQILTKETEFKIAHRFGKSVTRCKKFQSRGFTFTNLSTLTYKNFHHSFYRHYDTCIVVEVKNSDNDGVREIKQYSKYTSLPQNLYEEIMTIITNNINRHTLCTDQKCHINLFNPDCNHYHKHNHNQTYEYIIVEAD
jgi:hypothetical protein